MGIASNIEFFRNQKGYSKAFLAKKLFISTKRLTTLIKKDTKMTIEQLQQFAEVLNLPVSEFMVDQLRPFGNDNEDVAELKSKIKDLKRWLNQKDHYIVLLEKDYGQNVSKLNAKISKLELILKDNMQTLIDVLGVEKVMAFFK